MNLQCWWLRELSRITCIPVAGCFSSDPHPDVNEGKINRKPLHGRIGKYGFLQCFFLSGNKISHLCRICQRHPFPAAWLIQVTPHRKIGPKSFKACPSKTKALKPNSPVDVPSGYLTLPWKTHPFLIGKPSISMGHLYHGFTTFLTGFPLAKQRLCPCARCAGSPRHAKPAGRTTRERRPNKVWGFHTYDVCMFFF